MAASTVTGTTSDGVTVVVQLEPAPPSEEHLADIGVVFSAFLVAAVVVFCSRQLVNLFRLPAHED